MSNQTKQQLKKERDERRTAQFAATLKNSKKIKKQRLDVLEELSQNKDYFNKSSELKTLTIKDQEFIIHFKTSKMVEKNKFWSFLKILDKKSSLVNEVPIVWLYNVFEFKQNWIQSPEQWSKKSSNSEKQFQSLVLFLFSKYALPEFFIKIWQQEFHIFRMKQSKQEIEWFFHLASGKNIRTAKNLPFKISPKVAHYFLSAPSDYSVVQAMVFGQLTAMRAESRLIKELCNNLKMQDLEQNHWWTTAYQFFINNPFLDIMHVHPILDYIRYYKFSENAPDPEFSIKGKNAARILKLVEDWHLSLHNLNKTKSYCWEATFDKFSYQENGKNPIFWEIVELTNSKSLHLEGKILNHCVASYDKSCFEKKCAILSLQKQGEAQATIEVNLITKKIMQARGRANRLLNAKELMVVQRWVDSDLFFR